MVDLVLLQDRLEQLCRRRYCGVVSIIGIGFVGIVSIFGIVGIIGIVGIVGIGILQH